MDRRLVVTTVLTLILGPCCCFLSQPVTDRRAFELCAETQHGRREFVASQVAAFSLLFPAQPLPALAVEGEDDGDLTTAMFNPDGSLKEGFENEAKFWRVEFDWDADDSSLDVYTINVDGKDTTERVDRKSSEGQVRLSYDLPLKFSPGTKPEELYTDLTVKQEKGDDRVKALKSITIYQSPGLVKQDRLEKATTIGIAKALNVLPGLSALESADLVGGRVRSVGPDKKQKMFDFDLAVAPKTCPDSADNLGLGFCPFETIYLLSGTIVRNRLFVFALQCDKDQWKRSNADLRKVRSTFSVSVV